MTFLFSSPSLNDLSPLVRVMQQHMTITDTTEPEEGRGEAYSEHICSSTLTSFSS